MGYNELSREVYLTNFLKGKCDKGDIKDQSLAIEILHGCAMGIHNYYKNKKKPVNIDVRNDYTYPINISELKKYSNKQSINEDKKMIKILPDVDKNGYNLSVIMNHIIGRDVYEIYLYIADSKNIASGLLLKEYKSKVMANI